MTANHEADSLDEKLALARESWVNIWSMDELRSFVAYAYRQLLIVLRVEVYEVRDDSYVPLTEYTFYMDSAPSDGVNRIPENKTAISKLIELLEADGRSLHHQVWVSEPF